MKKLLFQSLLYFALPLLFVSCQKDAEVADDLVTVSEEYSSLINLNEDLDDELDYQLDEIFYQEITDRSACPAITLSAPKGTYPNTITIDFGSSGCVGKNGHTISGLIVVVISDTLIKPGATKSVSYIDFHIDGALIAGVKLLRNEGLNSDGVPCFSRVVDKVITLPDGTSRSFEANHTICVVEGAGTPRLIDDVVEITGTANGTDRNGNAFDSEIIQPLLKPRNCRYVVDGSVEITKNNQTAILDFGNGFCDRFAQLTLPGGQTKSILLDPWWRR